MNRGLHQLHVAFRVDASVDIGTGHVMRCLTLADRLRERDAICQFVCRPHPGNLLDVIHRRGYQSVALPALTAHSSLSQMTGIHASWLGTGWNEDADDTRRALGVSAVDWLIVDHYGLEAKWEGALRPACRHMMVIDDLADRHHDCDLLLDQNLGRASEDYDGLLPVVATKLIGPRYALLRPEFSKWRELSLARRFRPQVKRLLVTMGGVDRDNATAQVLEVLSAYPLPQEMDITIVMGLRAPWLRQIQDRARRMPRSTRVLTDVGNMAELMASSDLAIGAAGSTSWERCCLGLPSIQIVLAGNQTMISEALNKAGVAVTADATTLQNVLTSLLLDSTFDRLHAMSMAAREVTDGSGAWVVAENIVRESL